MRRLITSILAGVALMVGPAFAAEPATTPPATLQISDAALAAVVAAAPETPAADFHTSVVVRRPAALAPLYAASAALQGYDAYSTLSVLKTGGVEANPLMKNAVKSPAAFVAVKASVTVLSIAAAEKMWKRGNRIGAIGVMVATNVAMGVVAANNARVMSTIR